MIAKYTFDLGIFGEQDLTLHTDGLIVQEVYPGSDPLPRALWDNEHFLNVAKDNLQNESNA